MRTPVQIAAVALAAAALAVATTTLAANEDDEPMADLLERSMTVPVASRHEHALL